MSIEVQEGIVLWSATRASQIQPVNLGDIVYASDGSSYIDLGDKYGFQGQYVRY
jgi:hypothetical protein